MDSRCLSTAAFVKETDSLFGSFNGVAHNPNCGKVLHCQLSSTSEHLEYRQNVASKIENWTFLNKECEQIRPPPSQTGLLITVAAVQHVWRRVKEKQFKYLETRNLNQDALENTSGAIHFHCGCKNNPSVGQFVNALKTVIINGRAYRGLLDLNCEDDGAILLDNLHSFLKPSSVSSPSQSISHDREASYAKKVFILQKKIIRIITNTRPRDSCKKVFKKVEKKTLNSQYIYSLILYTVNNKHLFNTNNEVHNYKTRYKMIYITQYQTHLNSIKQLIYQELKSSITFPNILKQCLMIKNVLKSHYRSFYIIILSTQ
jgi:hypothetical protein